MDIKKDFHWINEGEIVIEENRITMTAPALTDFFLWRRNNKRRRHPA